MRKAVAFSKQPAKEDLYKGTTPMTTGALKVAQKALTQGGY